MLKENVVQHKCKYQEVHNVEENVFRLSISENKSRRSSFSDTNASLNLKMDTGPLLH